MLRQSGGVLQGYPFVLLSVISLCVLPNLPEAVLKVGLMSATLWVTIIQLVLKYRHSTD